MKKNIVGIFAVIIALGASAFTMPKTASHKGTQDLKWFRISGSIAATAATPSANATYLPGDDGPTPPASDCSGSGNQCVSGFASSQVNASTEKLIGTQTPVDVSSQQN